MQKYFIIKLGVKYDIAFYFKFCIFNAKLWFYRLEFEGYFRNFKNIIK